MSVKFLLKISCIVCMNLANRFTHISFISFMFTIILHLLCTHLHKYAVMVAKYFYLL